MEALAYDLAIIGGGPAGTSAAITAARVGAKVILCEARDYPRHKVCGEFVSAEALQLLCDLLGDSERARLLTERAPAMDTARLLLGNRVIETRISPPARSITRFDLDAALWAAAQSAGGHTRSNCEVFSVSGDGPFELKTSLGCYVAKAVVIAAGRWSQFTSDRSIPAGPKWIGLKAHFREPVPSRSTDLYFFDHGYCGVQPVGDEVVNACAMVRSDRATTLAEVFVAHPKLAARAAAWTPLMPPVSTAPLVYRRPQPTSGNTLFVGDAAAFIDPFVGDGISIALRSGALASLCLAAFVRGEAALSDCAAHYEREYRRQFAPLLLAASRVRWLLSLPAQARAAAFELLRIPGIMPMVIRKTRRA